MVSKKLPDAKLEIGGKVKEINLNNRTIGVITPKKAVSYEEGLKNVDKIVKKIKSE